MKLRLWMLCLLLFGVIAGGVSAQDVPQVVATTTIVADVAQIVGGEFVDVTPLVPRDADAHAFILNPTDATRIADADMLLMVGASYETFLGDLLDTLAGDHTQLVTVSNGIDMLAYEGEHAHEDEANAADDHHEAEYIGVLGSPDLDCTAATHDAEEEADTGDEHLHGACDPHVWMNPHNVMIWANNIADAFNALDPEHAGSFRANADAYISQLEALDSELTEILAVVPEDARKLVTNHEFMGYFAATYDFEVVATVFPSASTLAELDPRSLIALIETIQTENVPAIFAEVSGNSEVAQVVAQEAGVQVVTSLYSESLSDVDGPAATYLDFMRFNAHTIADALSG
ncbi:MAG: zinc ABC transporter substrate-binding protein [Anaerolineae bacterium]|nr:zinc ABC transporter substrate-binding protein [Anaerolineae bacterium]